MQDAVIEEVDVTVTVKVDDTVDLTVLIVFDVLVDVVVVVTVVLLVTVIVDVARLNCRGCRPAARLKSSRASSKTPWRNRDVWEPRIGCKANRTGRR